MSSTSEHRALPPARSKAVVASGALLAALALAYAALVTRAPVDAVQGIVQKILYVHVPCAFAAYVGFAVTAVAGCLYLWREDERFDRVAIAGAEVGVLFCTLNILSGPIWAKATWGHWWTWDPRLTLTLVLWMIYAAYLLLRNVATDPERGAVFASILGVSGVVDLYLINRAVYWWRGIHPAVLVTREGSSGMTDPLMRLTLTTCMLAFFLLFLWLLRIRLRTARLQDTVDEFREELVQSPTSKV